MLNCCPNCFTDQFIRSKIELAGKKGDCNFCLVKDTKVLDPSLLRIYFEPLISLYSPIKNRSSKAGKKSIKGGILSQKLTDDWGIFKIETNGVQNILDCIFPEHKGSLLFSDKVDLSRSGFLNSKSLDVQLEESWQEFTNELKIKNRFFPSAELDLENLELLLQNLDIKLKKDQIFYRARISDNDKKILKRNMGAPPAKKVRNGRGNPVGIPYLYLASDVNTGISEVRPSILDYITLGEFKLKQDIHVIDLRYISPFNFSLSEDFEKLVFSVGHLRTLGSDLSKPINPRDADLEYLPTQYLCEFIKSKEWDAVLYNSSLSEGFNIAVFSEKYFNCTKTSLYHVDKPSYTYKKIR